MFFYKKMSLKNPKTLKNCEENLQHKLTEQPQKREFFLELFKS